MASKEPQLPAGISAFNVYDPKRDDAQEPVPLITAPPWRQFDDDRQLKYDYITTPETTRLINVAILLRRPLLVTGNPGTGKSSLAYSIARKLGYKSVLRWNITSRSTLKDGLYGYDVIQRLNDASLFRSLTESGKSIDETLAPDRIEHYIKLGPLGTALLPSVHPRVLLIDELDKADIDLPNDLLHVFEEGQFRIPELQQSLSKDQEVPIRTDDEGGSATTNGHVTCNEFPIVVLTSNAEREFSPAFLRRCIRLNITLPGPDDLLDIAKSHLGDLLNNVKDPDIMEIIDTFVNNRSKGMVANDQLMNALYLVAGVRAESALESEPKGHKEAIKAILDPLNRSTQQR